MGRIKYVRHGSDFSANFTRKTLSKILFGCPADGSGLFDLLRYRRERSRRYRYLPAVATASVRRRYDNRDGERRSTERSGSAEQSGTRPNSILALIRTVIGRREGKPESSRIRSLA
jgi:hypothetical protein